MRLLLLTLSLLVTSPAWAAEHVVLLHGLARSSDHMGKLEQALTKSGYEVVNIDYPSTKHDLQTLLPHIHEQIRHQTDPHAPLHIVAYSMGSILTRAWIATHNPPNLGRVVMLAPPNHGSEVVDAMGDSFWFKELYGPAAQQLHTNSLTLSELPQHVNYELGIIAGNQFIDPIGSLIINQPSDGRVSVESTKLSGMRDHITLPIAHPFTPQSALAIHQTLTFLQHGHFDRTED